MVQSILPLRSYPNFASRQGRQYQTAYSSNRRMKPIQFENFVSAQGVSPMRLFLETPKLHRNSTNPTEHQNAPSRLRQATTMPTTPVQFSAYRTR